MPANNTQLLKLGDDNQFVELTPDDNDTGLFVSGTDSSWINNGEKISVDQLRHRIEPWLTALCQSEHLNLLIGSGLSTAIQLSSTGEPPSGMGWVNDLAVLRSEIDRFVNESAEKAGRSTGNIEDQIRAINEAIRGLEILTVMRQAQPDNPPVPYAPYRNLADELAQLKSEFRRVIKSFSSSICAGETAIKEAERENSLETFNYLVSFLMSFAGRSATKDRLHIFTTNYDRIIEVGAELAGLRLIDRFVGSIAPIFRSSRLDVDFHYNPPGIRGEPRYLEGVARFTKLHGSLDWFEHDGNIRRLGVPFGAKSVGPFLEAEGGNPETFEQLMIYPNSSKDRETSEYPYVELFRDLAASSCRPNSTLVAYGYSFGDEHINRVISDMLTVPSTHVVIIAFGDPLGRIDRFVKESGRSAQLTVLIGSHLGDFKTLVDHYLPKPAIDRTTIKMADLLKQRGLIQKERAVDDPGGPGV